MPYYSIAAQLLVHAILYRYSAWQIGELPQVANSGPPPPCPHSWQAHGATEHNAVLCRWSPDLDREPSERCNITSPSLPNRSLAWIRCTSFTQGNWTDGWNNLKIISVHTLPKDTTILSKRPSFISLNTLLKRCVSGMLSNDCKLSYWPMRAAETDRYTED